MHNQEPHRPAPLALALVATAALAAPLAADCGVPSTGACCTPHAGTGCSDLACCTVVCNQDPFCCEVGWDGYCAAAAISLCGCTPEPIIVTAFGGPVTLPGGIEASACDLAAFDPSTSTWSIHFDGDDVGLTGKVLVAAARLPDGQLLVVPDSGGSLAGLAGGPDGTSYTAFDILRFAPATLGPETSGTWNFHFDGSDVGLLSTSARTLQTVTPLADGGLVVSLRGTTSVTGVGGVTARDLLKFSPTSLGAVTAGTWSRHFEGGDVGLTLAAESLDAASILDDGRIVLSMHGSFTAPGVSGGAGDLVIFAPTSLGATTAGGLTGFRFATDLGLAATQDLQAPFTMPLPLPSGPRPGVEPPGSPATCGDAEAGDCCTAHPTPHCADAGCCETVCAADPLCCTVAWDVYCVEAATVRCAPCRPEPLQVLSFGETLSLPGGIVAKACDLVAYDRAAAAWSVVLDGDDVGIGNRSILAAAPHPDGGLLVVLDGTGSIAALEGGPAGGAHESCDILRFVPTAYGDATAGSWQFHLDGSDLGLNATSDLAIRTLGVLADGSLLIGLRGPATLPGVGTVQPNDLVRLETTSRGRDSAGTWSMHLDGSDVGLTTTSERLDASGVEADGSLLLSCRGSFTVTGVSGGKANLFRFRPTATGDATAGTFEPFLPGTEMGLPTGVNTHSGCTLHPFLPASVRPAIPIVFEPMPDAAVTLDAIADEFQRMIIVYQGVDPLAGSTGLIDAATVIAAIRGEHGDDPVGWGVLDFENPFIERLEAGPSGEHWAMTVATVVDLLAAVKAEFPRVRWTMYGMPLVRYWIPPWYSWADAPPEVREAAIAASVEAFDPVLRACDWLNPSSYDRYDLSTYAAGARDGKTAEEIAWRTWQVEACLRFNAASGIPPKPILPMVSPLFWKSGQLDYQMKWIPDDEFLRDQVRPLMAAGADGVAIWSGMPYWVRAATSAQDLGTGQSDARFAFTLDVLGGTPPADWTDPAVRATLTDVTSARLRTRLDLVRSESEAIVFGPEGP